MEIRAVQAAPDNNEMIVEGRAIVFNSPTIMYEFDGVKYYETIDARALDNTDMRDVVFRYNHSSNVMIMARTKRGSLQLLKDNQGLSIRASLFDISPARDLYTLIRDGGISEMSFAFSVEEDDYDRKTHTRTIKKIKKLYDVAAVDSGAYSDTSILARSFFEMEVAKEKKAVESAELRKKLILKTFL